MGRYKRVTNRQDWETEQMIQAINNVVNKKKSIRSTALRFGVDKSTLCQAGQYRINPDMILACKEGATFSSFFFLSFYLFYLL